MTVLRSGSASVVGRVRAVNEDLSLESLTLFAVADGMGGHAGGEVAAYTAMEALQREFARQPTVQGLVGAVRQANQAVWSRSNEDPDLRGMGTTLTAAALVATEEGDRLVLANVGDSRSYRLHDGELTQLTRDHSQAQELLDRGELSEAEAAVHPHRHILTRALGVAPDVDVDVWLVAPEVGDRYLLCTDGLSNEVSSQRINGVLSSTPDPQEASDALVRIANEHGGNDNVTAVVLDVLVSDGLPAGAVGRVGVAPLGDSPGLARAPVAGPEPAAPPGRAEVDEASPARALLGRFGADAASGMRHMTRRAEEVQHHLRTRRVTFRVLLFLLVLAALAAGAVAAVRWYVDSSYFVQMHRGQVVVYRGRLGGFVGMEPRAVWRTGVPADQVPAVELPKVDHGVEESSLRGACNYVVNLTQEEAALQRAASATTVPVTTTTGPATSKPPLPSPGAPATPPTGAVPTLRLPKGCR